MDILDLSLLQKPPELNKEAILEITPLAPLSMVSELPGSYYKSLRSPNKKMICGLFENLLEWHIDAADRKEIIKEIKKIRKKQKMEFPEEGSGSNFSPLIAEYFEIKLEMFPTALHFDDYWSKAFRRADAIVHPKGTINISYELIPKKRELSRNEKKPAMIEDKALEKFFLDNKKNYPLFYSSPTKREYISLDGKYQIKIKIDTELYKMLKEKLTSINIAYLGNTEGWVDVNVNEL